MSSLFQFYKLLTSHPGSFLDYSAWISLRSFKSSDSGPCPTNKLPATEGLWIAKYIFDYFVPYLPEAYAEHDISLLTLDSAQFDFISTEEFSKLVYLVNRHLILDEKSNFYTFDESISSNYIDKSVNDSSEMLALQDSKFDEIHSFQKSISDGATDVPLALFLILCLATHTSYTLIASQLKIDSKASVKWDDDTSKRLIEMFDIVFPSSLATEDGDEDNTSASGRDTNDDSFINGDDDELEEAPLLSASGDPNQRSITHFADESEFFQTPLSQREVYLRVPLPKKGYKGEKDWVALGFQGANPTTDFRATGKLGLKQFEHFCLKNPIEARNIMTESGSFNGNLSKAWYSVALVSIHMTLFIQRMLGGRFIYRGLLFNLDLLKVYKSLVADYGQNPENVDVPMLLNKIEGNIAETLSNLHDVLLIKYHKFWKQEVKAGIVKTPLEVDASILRFQESIQYKLFDGEWTL